MKHLIKIHWVGFRKDSGKGSIWGYFTEVDKDIEKVYVWPLSVGIGKGHWIYQPCYVFRGKIGKSLLIEEQLLSDDFLASIPAMAKNYRQTDPVRITSKWGKALDEELGMFLTMLKLRG